MEEKRQRVVDAKRALEVLNEMNDGECDAGGISGLSDVSWVDSSSDGSSGSGLEPQRKVRRTGTGDGPTLVEECAAESGPSETGRDGTLWTTMRSGADTERLQVQNILTESAGPTPHARRDIRDKQSAFLCLCDAVMLQHIRECTVAEARRASEKTASWDVSLAELKAFIALLYVRGAYCGKNIEIESFWSEQWGNAFFLSTLSRNRFRDIMRFLRFDKTETQGCRLSTDRFALMADVWERFRQNCIACYKPGPNITVDEQLFPTKARCRFTQYMPNKPDKFGIKFWLAADVDSKYLLNGIPYLGKDERRSATQSLGENVVLELVKPFVGKGRNITTGNFFTSVPLADTLLSQNTSLVGAIKRNERELPPSVQRRAELFSTKLLKRGKITLTVYQCKPRKNVSILSTHHQHVAIPTDGKRKPETVTYYNKTKVGVNVLDQMARQYSVKGGTRRWPVAVFYNVLDLAAINACVLYRSCMNDSIPRRDFMLLLAEELRADWMASKEAPRFSITPADTREQRRMTCMVKDRCKQNKTFAKCLNCRKSVCGKCTAMVLNVCSKCV